MEHDKTLEINRKMCVIYVNYSIILWYQYFLHLGEKYCTKHNISYIHASMTGLMQKTPEVIKKYKCIVRDS